MNCPSRFLGVDLAWRGDNASGVVALAGRAFPLRVAATAHCRPTHAAVRAWIADQVRGRRAALGVDAPLLGLEGPRRRLADNLVSRHFGRFHASTHSLPRDVGHLARFTAGLRRRYGARSLAPDPCARSGSIAIREVYPNALQVLLFDLDRRRRSIVPYKRRRFGDNRGWVTRGLRPFIARCRRRLERGYVRPRSPGWRALVAEVPRVTMSTRELKAIEDRWDAVLCAIAVALEHLAPGTMRAYPGREGGAWRGGYILAPTLPTVRTRLPGRAGRPRRVTRPGLAGSP